MGLYLNFKFNCILIISSSSSTTVDKSSIYEQSKLVCAKIATPHLFFNL